MSDEDVYSSDMETSDEDYNGSDDNHESTDDEAEDMIDDDSDNDEDDDEPSKAMATEPPLVSPTPSDPPDPVIPSKKLAGTRVNIVRPKPLKDANSGEHVVVAAPAPNDQCRVYDPAQLRNTEIDHHGLVLISSTKFTGHKHWGFIVPSRSQTTEQALESIRSGSPVDVVLMNKSAEWKRIKATFGSTPENGSSKGTKMSQKLKDLVVASSSPHDKIADPARAELTKLYPNAMKKLCYPLLSYSSWKTEAKPTVDPKPKPVDETPKSEAAPKPKPKPKPKVKSIELKKPEPTVKPGPSPSKPRKRPPVETEAIAPKRLCPQKLDFEADAKLPIYDIQINIRNLDASAAVATASKLQRVFVNLGAK